MNITILNKSLKKMFPKLHKRGSLILVLMLVLQLFPLQVFAMSEAPPGEKVIFQTGRWQFDSEKIETGQEKIWSMYIGDKDKERVKPPSKITFSVRQTTILSRIHVEYNRLREKTADGTSHSGSDTMKNGEVMVSIDEKAAETAALKSKQNSAIKEGEVLVSVDENTNSLPDGVNPLTQTTLTLKDKKGTVIGNWNVQIEFAYGVSNSNQEPPKSAPGVALIEQDNILLKPGTYTIDLSDENMAMYNKDTDYVPAVAVIGINYDAWKKYQEALKAASKKKTSDQDKELIEIGQVMVTLGAETQYQPKNQEIPKQAKQSGKLKPAVFELKAEKMIEEIQTDHFNGGKGAPLGNIKLVGGSGNTAKIYGPWPVKGGKLSGADNGVWVAKPKVVLPPGVYTIIDSSPDTLSYDPATLEPSFYVKAVQPPRFDFTGTYYISIKTAVTKCMNSAKIGQPSKFDRDNFEIAVLDKGEYMEVIGRYTQEKKKDILSQNTMTEYDFNNVPFSQLCKVIKRDATSAVVLFKLDIDLTNLPYRAKVGVNVPLNFDTRDGYPRLTAEGSAYYIRAFKEGYGADNNEYSVKVAGQRSYEQLPDYVRYEMTKVKNLGNIPGPENGIQGAVGTLFPPLAVLILQIALTMKKPKKITPPPEDSGDSSSSGDGGSGDSGDSEDGGDSSDSGEDSSDSGEDSSDSGEDTDGGNSGGDSDSSGNSDEDGDHDTDDGDSQYDTGSSDETNTDGVGDNTSQNNGENKEATASGNHTDQSGTNTQNNGASDTEKTERDNSTGADSTKDPTQNTSGSTIGNQGQKPDNAENKTDGKQDGNAQTPDGEDKKDWINDFEKPDWFDGESTKFGYNKDGYVNKVNAVGDFINDLQQAFGGGNIDDAVKNFADAVKNDTHVGLGGQITHGADYQQALKDLQGAKWGNTVKNVGNFILNGIDKGFTIGGVIFDSISNMQDKTAADGSKIEGDPWYKSIGKAAGATAANGALGEANPGLAVMEFVNYTLFGGTKAQEMISPSGNVSGFFNYVADKAIDYANGTNIASKRVESGAYGENMKNFASAAGLLNDLKNNPQKFGQEWSSVVQDGNFYKGMHNTVKEIFTPEKGFDKGVLGTLKQGASWTGQKAFGGLVHSAEATKDLAQYFGGKSATEIIKDMPDVASATYEATKMTVKDLGSAAYNGGSAAVQGIKDTATYAAGKATDAASAAYNAAAHPIDTVTSGYKTVSNVASSGASWVYGKMSGWFSGSTPKGGK